jgi:hypothetical protein
MPFRGTLRSARVNLADAIKAEDWPRALDAALAAWRATRDPVVAHVVDRIGARVARLQPPAHDLHAWWIEHAATYDPVAVTTLLDLIAIRLRSSDVAWSVAATRSTPQILALVGDETRTCATSWLDRLAALERWPDDPRLAPVLLAWLIGHARPVAAPVHAGFQRLLASNLARLADVRIVPRLEAYRRHRDAIERAMTPPGSPARSAHGHVDELLTTLGRVRPTASGAASLVERLDRPTRLEQLWRDAADDPAAREVLGDALVAAGDTRGTFIALQRSPDRRRTRSAQRLLSVEWERWLGPDLASIAARDGTVFEGGMLEVLRAGHHFTPP